ncbi:unnamed protein product [Cylicostephanus goldi]|uniref:L-Fucosyltransferase n=1 Tax=Cylicostephanus goldi TaxID=71465 RepID=A0A3P6S014_CYLGO|nr:unnamed protein product [Cylicostephanus goldi]
MYALASGYAIARRLGRTLYYPTDGSDKFLCYLELISHVFPRTTSVYTIIPIKHVELTIVPFATDEQGLRTCCRYDDPTRGDASDFMCVHIRRSDYLDFGVNSDLPSTLRAAEDIAAKKWLVVSNGANFGGGNFGAPVDVRHCFLFVGSNLTRYVKNLTNYLIFGDDKKFMEKLALLLSTNNSGQERVVRSSTFPEITDFYVAHRFCKAFFMRVPTSTFAWWLAFFSRDQDSIFYYQNHLVDEGLKPDFHL